MLNFYNKVPFFIMLCPPAAATSRARRDLLCPFRFFQVYSSVISAPSLLYDRNVLFGLGVFISARINISYPLIFIKEIRFGYQMVLIKRRKSVSLQRKVTSKSELKYKKVAQKSVKKKGNAYV